MELESDVDSQPVSLRFQPQYRLRKTDEYSSVFAFRKAVRGRFFMLHYRPGTGVRVGIVVAKRLAKRAVQRNLIKRLGRESFRHVRAELPAYDLILRLSTGVKGATRAELRADIGRLFKKLPS